MISVVQSTYALPPFMFLNRMDMRTVIVLANGVASVYQRLRSGWRFTAMLFAYWTPTYFSQNHHKPHFLLLYSCH